MISELRADGLRPPVPYDVPDVQGVEVAAKNASLGPADTESGRGLVKSAERTARIMETLAESADGLSLSGLQERTGYPAPACTPCCAR